MHRLGVPNGLKTLGFSHEDIPGLVRGTLPQRRVLNLSPRHVDEKELYHLFEQTYELY